MTLDLCQAEHLWDILGKRAQRQPHKPQDINELADELQEEWQWIPKANHCMAHQKHEASASHMPGSELRLYSLLRLL